MNRRIGRLVKVGLLAVLPMGWSAGALAQTMTRDPGINPLDDSPLTPDQKRANDIDQKLGNPSSGVGREAAPSVGNRSDTMGTSGSSGAPSGKKDDQSGSQMSGSSGAVPGSADTDDKRANDKGVKDDKGPSDDKGSSDDRGATGLDRETHQSDDDTTK